MSVKLNFIPNKSIKKISNISVITWIKIFLYNIILLLMIFNCFLIVMYFVLNEQLEMFHLRTDQMSQSNASSITEIEKSKNSIKKLYQTGLNFQLLTPRFWEIIESVPTNIYLKNIALKIDSTTIIIPGVAKTRDALIKYEKVLSELSWVIKTNLPRSQFLQKENINFEIELIVKPLFYNK